MLGEMSLLTAACAFRPAPPHARCLLAVLDAQALDRMITKTPAGAGAAGLPVAADCRCACARSARASALCFPAPDPLTALHSGAPEDFTMERDQASKFINDLLRLMVTRNGLRPFP